MLVNYRSTVKITPICLHERLIKIQQNNQPVEEVTSMEPALAA